MYRVYQVIKEEEHQRNTAFFKNTTLVIIMIIVTLYFSAYSMLHLVRNQATKY